MKKRELNNKKIKLNIKIIIFVIVIISFLILSITLAKYTFKVENTHQIESSAFYFNSDIIGDYETEEWNGDNDLEINFSVKNYENNNLITNGNITYNVEVEKLDQKIEELGNTSIKSSSNPKVSRKVSQLATMRTADIEDLGFVRTDYNELVTKYNTYKTLLTEVKAKVFQYMDFEYNKNTGRITKMKYKL